MNAVACLARLYEARIGWLSLTLGDGGIIDPAGLDRAWRDLRDDRARGVSESVRQTPLTLRFYRPDGMEHRRLVLPGSADMGGARVAALPFRRAAPTGRWTVAAHLGINEAPLGQADFLVEDFVSPRIEVAVTPQAKAIRPGETVAIAIEGAFLHGVPASDLAGEAKVFLETDPEPFPEFRRLRFGLMEEEFVAW